MNKKQSLGVTDYVIVVLSLLVSAFIGLRFRFAGGKQKTTAEFLLANKNASMVLVVTSASVTMLSAVAMVGNPAEVYRFGTQYIMAGLFQAIGILLSCKLFLPVYFRCKVCSIYEFLEMRYGKITRYTVSTVFVLQMVLYMSSVLYAAVLSLSAVTDFSIDVAIILCGVVCSFYCFMGGLKAVLWTDLYQCILMFLCLIIIYVVGIKETGGIGEVYRRTAAGNRFEFFNMRLDFITRYTFWNMLFRGLWVGLARYGTNQVEVQRSLSMRECKKAQTALQWSAVIAGILHLMCSLIGLLLYAVFYLCDPVLMQEKTGITRYDQMVPYYIITRMKSIPGLTGLCFAGIFSGSLSTISSALNSAVTVAVVDFIQPSFANKLDETKLVYIAKGLTLVFGIVFIGITFAITNVDSIVQVAIVFLSVVDGPVLSLFLIGVLTRKVSDKSTFIGFLLGLFLSCWIGFGSMFGGYRYPSLPVETHGCPTAENATVNLFNNSSQICFGSKNCTFTALTDKSSEIFVLYKMPFAWISTIGVISTLLLVSVVSILTDRNRNMVPADSKCLSPVYHWIKRRLSVNVAH